MAAKSIWAEVTCDIHGSIEGDDPSRIRRVKTSIPRHKRDRRAGCHICSKINASKK